MRQRCHAAPGRVAAIAATSPRVGVGGDEPDPGQAAGGEVAEERQPAGAVLAGGDLDAEDLAVPVGVDAGRDQCVDRHDPATLADLEHQRVGGHERERAGVARGERVRNSSTWASSSLAISETWDFDRLVMPSDCTSLSIRRVETPSR